MSLGNVRSQDVLLLCKLLVQSGGERLRQLDLSQALGISQSEVSEGIDRLKKSHLIEPKSRAPNLLASIEFLECAVKYIFPAEMIEPCFGIPTGTFAPKLSKQLIEKGIPLVWPAKGGKVQGMGVRPIHVSAPQAANQDQKLYELLTLIDALRTDFSPRVKEVAKSEIRKIVLGEKSEQARRSQT